MGELEFISGKNNIILIAPHGHPKNDMNTGDLARRMAKKLGCYAVINEHYRRPYQDKETKIIYRTNKKGGIVDLNNIPSIKTAGMEKEFLQSIFDIKKKILAEDGNDQVFIIHIHGIGDDKYKESDDIKPPILVGIGKKNKDDRFSANVDTVKQIIKIMGENVAHPIPARIEQGGGYSGWANHNLNQLFTGFVKPDYKDKRVQSIQLEIKFTRYRDMDNLDKTADVLSSALRDIAGLKKEELLQQLPEKVVVTAAEQEKLLELVEIKSTNTERQLSKNEEKVAITQNSLLVAEEHPDDTLVEMAYSKLAGIFFSHYQNALLEAGQYIITTFYDNDIERARLKKPVKELSYTQLIEHLQEKKEDSPRKSWLFNAVNLVIQEHDFASVQALGQLPTTQKILLLPVSDRDLKHRLAKEASEKKFTTRQLAEAIKKSKPEPKETLLSYIKKPEELFSEEHANMCSKESLEALTPKARAAIKKNINSEIQKVKEQITCQQEYLKRYAELASDLELIK